MSVNKDAVRVRYVEGMKDLAERYLQFARDYDQLASLYTGAQLAGTFVDGDFVASELKHLDAVLVGTITGNLVTLRSAATGTIVNNLANAVGRRIT